MQLRTLDELEPGMMASRAGMDMAGYWDPPTPPRDRLAKRSGLMAPYVGIFAVEGGEVVGQTLVRRFPFHFPDGAGRAAGISAVLTRPDRGGRGIATRVLREVHRREHEAGVDHFLLWTNRSWAAHGVYEKLGYRDLYQPPVAFRWSPAAGSTIHGVKVRPVRRGDLPALEDLHARATEGRLGFTPRPPRWLRAHEMGLGEALYEGFWMALRDREPVGFVRFETTPLRVRCSELVSVNPLATRAFLHLQSKLARGKWSAVGMTVFPEALRYWRGRYATTRGAWLRLMGARWGAEKTSVAGLVGEFGADDPRWTCMHADRF